MAADTALDRGGAVESPTRGLAFLPAIGWRNLWRNRRRTWLTAGGIAFAILLSNFAMSIQAGTYGQMIEIATSLFIGHAQIQNPRYVDQERLEHTIKHVTALVSRLEAEPGVVAVSPRVEAFGLLSVDERSFGARVIGVDPAAERRVSSVLDSIARGRALEGQEEAVIGSGLARNLGAEVGDELVVLGSGREGGVAAMVLTLVGIFETGQSQLDRSIAYAPLAAVQSAFGLGDEAHTLAVRTTGVHQVHEVVDRLSKSVLPDMDQPLRVRTWDEVLPEVRQAIEVDRISGMFFYVLVLLLITFSAVNTFIMTVFERTREFGVLLAMGMRPGQLFALLLTEASFMWLIGAALGVFLASAVITYLGAEGIPLGDLEDLGAQLYMPDRLVARYSVVSMVTAPAVLLVGTLVAAVIPGARLFRLKPVEALRGD